MSTERSVGRHAGMTDRVRPPALLVEAMERYGITALEVHHLKHIAWRGDPPRTPEAWFAIAQVARCTVWDKLDPSSQDWYLLYTVIKGVCEQPRVSRKVATIS